MSALSEVALYFRDEDLPFQTIPRARAREWRSAGRGQFVDHGRGFRLFAERPAPRFWTPPDRPGSFERSCTISLREMLANAGITTNDAGDVESVALPYVVLYAQEKIRQYPHVSDDFAPLARGSHSCDLGDLKIVVQTDSVPRRRRRV